MPGVIIGKVAVKVVPDTTDFRRDTQRKLDAEEKRLTAVVQTKADLTGAKRDLLEGIRELNAENRSRDAYKVKLYTTLDLGTVRMREELNKAVRRYEELSRTNQVDLQTGLDKPNLAVVLDTNDENLKATKEKIDHWRRSMSPVEIPVHLDLNNQLARFTEAKIKVLTRPRSVDILPRINKVAMAKAKATLAALSGGRALHKFFDDFAEWVGNLDRSLPKIAAVGLGIMGLGAWGATASANLFALAASLAQIAGAGLALPGILGGMAVGLTVTIVAFKDFKKYVPEVSSAWSDLKSTISENFWSKAQAPIKNFVDKLLPEFTQGFGKASSAIGGYFGSLAHKIGTAFDGPVKGMFADLTKSIHVATGGTGALAGIITTLGRTGASYLPRLAKWFVSISDRFDKFLTKAANNGSLNTWIDNGIKALHDLGQVLKNIGGIFAGLSHAMTKAGGSTLNMFAATLAKVNKVVNSPGFQKGMTDVFHAAFSAMHNIATQAGPAVDRMFTNLGKTLTSMLPAVGTALGRIGNTIASVLGSKAVNKGIIDFFHGVEQAIRQLQPVVKQLTPVIGQLLTFLGQFAKQLGGVLAQAVKDLIPLLGSMLGALKPVMEILTSGLTGALKILNPLMTTFGTIIGSVVVPVYLAVAALKALRTASLAVIATSKALWNGFRTGVYFLTDFIAGFRDARAAESAFTGTAGTMGGRVRAMFSGMSDGAKAFASTVAGISIGVVVGQLTKDSSTGVKALGTLASAAAGAAAGFAMSGAWGAALGAAGGLLGSLTGWLGGATKATQALKQETDDLTQSIIDNNGAIGSNTRALVVKALQDNGAFDAANKLGISLKTLTSAALDQAGALATVKSRLSDVEKGFANYSGDMVGPTGGAADVNDAIQKINSSLGQQSGAVKDAVDRAKNYKSAMGSAGTATDNTTNSLHDAKNALDATSRSTQVLTDRLAKLGNGALDVKSSYVDFKLSVKALTAGFKQNGTAIQGNTTKALNNKQALIAAVNAAKAHAQSLVAQGKKTKDVNAALKEDIQFLTQQARQSSLSGKALHGFLQNVGALPGQIKNSLKGSGKSGQNAGQAIAQSMAKGLQAKLPEIRNAAVKGVDAAKKPVQQAPKSVKAAAVGIGNAVAAGIKQGASKAPSQMHAVMTSVRNSITNSGIVWGSLLVTAGQSIIAGLQSGINSRIGAVQASLHKLTRDIPKWKGPAQTDRNLLVNAGKIIMDGLLRGLESQYDPIKQSLGKLTRKLPELLHENLAHLPYETRLATKGIAQAAEGALKAWKQVSDQLDNARQKLSDLKSAANDYYKSIKANVISTGDFTQFDLSSAYTPASAFTAITKSLGKARNQARQFARDLKALKKAGLSKTAIDQLAQAGPEQGLKSAKAILDAGKKGVDQVNKLQRQIARAAASTAKTATNSMYQQGIQTAQGFVNGLKSQKKALDKEFTALAKELVRIVKQELGIHSPSRVFHEIGAFTGIGLLNGLESQYGSVKDSLRRFAKDVSATDFGVPTVALGAEVSAAAARASANSGSNSGSNSTTNNTLNYYAPAGSAALSSHEQLFKASKRPRFGW